MLMPLAKPAATAAPEDITEAFRDRWLSVGFATGCAPRAEAEAAVKKMYQAAGLEPPRNIVWSASPFAQGLVRSIVLDPAFSEQAIEHTWKNALNPAGTQLQPMIAEAYRNSMRLFDTEAVKKRLYEMVFNGLRAAMVERWTTRMAPQVRADAGEAVWNGVWKSIWASVGPALMAGITIGMRQMASTDTPDRAILRSAVATALQCCIGDCVKTQVWETPMDLAWGNVRKAMPSQARVQAWERLWKTLQAAIWQNVAAPIGERIKACDNDSAQNSGYGQHDAYWLAFYEYFREAHGLVAETEPVAPLLALAPLAGWFVPHQHICWICERPSVLRLDRRAHLRDANAPAIVYPDGWSVYADFGASQPATAPEAVSR